MAIHNSPQAILKIQMQSATTDDTNILFSSWMFRKISFDNFTIHHYSGREPRRRFQVSHSLCQQASNEFSHA